MATHLPNVFNIPMKDEELKEIIEKSKDWALMHGAAMRSRTQFNSDVLQFAPFILTPSPFPRKEFNRSIQLQVVLNELMHHVAHDRQFLTETLKETIKVDEFTGNLFRIYETVHNEGVTQLLSLGLLRSDYMLNDNDDKTSGDDAIKQVEINTIASSFGGISTALVDFNRYILQELGHFDKLKNLAPNNALEGLCQGMLDAWKLYGNPDAVILFIVEDITYNICDQRFHEFEIRRLSPTTKVIRKTLTQIATNASIGKEQELLIDGNTVAVIYFRAGYEPGHYHTKKEWDARLLMERSSAIKCPSIQYHLAGTKKVQQALAKPGTVQKYLSDVNKVKAVESIFAGLYSLDFDEFGEKAVQMALNTPEKFVLKPQREGGGNNVYGAEVRDAVLKMKDSQERTAWILMERIHPPLITGYMVRPGGPEVPKPVELISELGIFGVVIGDSKKIFINKQVGHMLRTKVSTANEGGVAAGLGALDSPYLID